MTSTTSGTAPDSVVFAWREVIRRARIGRTTTAVALTLSFYADCSGRASPGVAALAVDCEMAYNTVQSSLARLRAAGLIVKEGRTKGADRRRRADIYRLELPADLASRITLPTPDERRAAIASITAHNRAPTGLHPVPRDTEGPEDPSARDTAQ